MELILHIPLITTIFSGNNVVSHINEILNILDGQIKISVDPLLFRPSAKIYFQVEFQVISNAFMFIS
jgi:hypothetical protein